MVKIFELILSMFLILIFIICGSQPLFGYIDTGTFYAFIQFILASIVGMIVMFKNYIYIFLQKLFKNKK